MTCERKIVKHLWDVSLNSLCPHLFTFIQTFVLIVHENYVKCYYMHNFSSHTHFPSIISSSASFCLQNGERSMQRQVRKALPTHRPYSYLPSESLVSRFTQSEANGYPQRQLVMEIIQ